MTPDQIKAMPDGIAKKAATLRLLRDKENELNNKLKKIKDARDAVEAEILMSMEMDGQKSIKLDEIGTITRSSRVTITISDMAKLAEFMAKQISAGDNPLEALNLLQQRAQQTNIQALLDAGHTPEELGVGIIEKPTLSFRK